MRVVLRTVTFIMTWWLWVPELLLSLCRRERSVPPLTYQTSRYEATSCPFRLFCTWHWVSLQREQSLTGSPGGLSHPQWCCGHAWTSSSDTAYADLPEPHMLSPKGSSPSSLLSSQAHLHHLFFGQNGYHSISLNSGSVSGPSNMMYL